MYYTEDDPDDGIARRFRADSNGGSDLNGPGGEAGLIAWIRGRIAAHPRVPLGPGDDAAVVRFPEPADCVVTTDMLLDGSCFDLAEAGPFRVGRKAMAVNLSDLAAMAARPLAAVVSVGLPRSGGRQLGEELFRGMRSIADEFGVAIVGGDTNTWEGPLVVSVAMLGETTAKWAVTRAGAKPGDWIFVTGPLGGSIRGHHLDFTPRVREALALHAEFDLHSLTDISDGFALDLHHILDASGCGAVVDAERIPIADAARQMGDGRSPLDHALSDGEDFELIFTVAEAVGRRIPAAMATRIGTCIDADVWLETDGIRTPLAPRGYEHRFAAKP